MAQVMIVDDNAEIVEMIKRALLPQQLSFTTAYSGQKALDLLRRERPDLLILDIVMPDISGIEVCKFVRIHPDLMSIPILFLSVQEDIEDKIAGFEAGCDDYLTKPFHPSELRLRVKALLRSSGSLPARNDPLSIGPIRIDPSDNKVHIKGIPVLLTSIETRLFYYLVLHSGKVISSERLLEQVWDYPPGTGSSSLVRMHVLNLRRKIEEDPHHPQLIRTASRHGYVFYPHPHDK